MATLPRTRLLEAIRGHPHESPAVVHSLSGRTFTYGSLLRDVAETKGKLLEETGKNGDVKEGLAGQRVAFLIENSYDYVGAPGPVYLCYE